MLTRRRALTLTLLPIVALTALAAFIFAFGAAPPALAQDDDTETKIVDGGGGARGSEPANVQVAPGDGELTVSWTVTSRDGVDDGEIYHALRWSQVEGVFHNDSMPRHPRWAGNDPDLPPIHGMLIEPGVTSYKITGLKNRVVTGVHVRSFTGDFRSQGATASSRWVRVKGKATTPVADEVTFDQAGYAVTEGGTVSLGMTRYAIAAATLNDPLTVTLDTADGTAAAADYTGFAGRSVAMAANVATANSSVVTASDDLVEEDETLTVTISVPETSAFQAGDPATATVTIQDDDRANARIAFGSSAAGTTKYTATAAEADGTLNVPVTVSHLPGASTTFAVEVLSAGTAKESSDFSIAAKSVTFGPATAKTQNVAIALTDDSDYETDETIELRIVAADSSPDDLGDYYARHAAGATATVTVTSADARATSKTWSIPGAVSVTEGQNAEVTITLGEATAEDLEFSVRVVYDDYKLGVAVPNDVNNFRTATHTVAAGKSSSVISIPVPTDGVVEPPQTFTVRVATDDIRWSLASAGGNRSVVTIQDKERETAQVAFGTSPASTAKYTATVAENAAGGILSVPVALSHPVEGGVTFRVEVLSASTAGLDRDYRLGRGGISVNSGSKTATLGIVLIDDALYEGDETIELRIVAADDPANDPSDYYARDAAGATATITITSDDSHFATVNKANLTVEEGGTATYTVVLTDEPTADVTVTPVASTVAATVSGPVTFTRLNWSVPQEITVTGTSAPQALTISHTVSSSDANFSSSKTQSVKVSVTAATTPAPTPTPTNTPAATKFYEITSAVTATEGQEAALTVTLSEAAPAAMTFNVNYHYDTGSTAHAADTLPRRPTAVTVAAGNTTAVTRVPIARDTLVESDETLKVSITPGAGVTAEWGKKADGAATAAITIKDATIAVSLAQNAYRVGEGDRAVSVVINFGSALRENVRALLTVLGNGSTTATSGLDFTSPPATGVEIAQGSATFSYRVAIVDDNLGETDEKITMRLSISPVAGYSLGAPGAADVVITIVDNDTPGVAVSESSRSVMENATATYTVALQTRPKAGVTVTPTSGATDQATVSGPVSFTTANWNEPQTVTVTGVKEGAATISHQASSTDAAYGSSLSIDSVAVTVTPSSVYEISSAATAREGSSAELTITLHEAAPTGGLEFTVTPTYATGAGKAAAVDLSSPPATVTVAENQRTATLTIPIAPDSLTEGDETFTVVVATGAAGWSKIADGADTATVTITDVASAGVTINPTTLSVVEFGENTYTVVLGFRPTHNVTVTPTSGATTHATVGDAVTFSPDNWNTPQPITVEGKQEGSATVSHAVTSDDARYNGLTPASVTVTVTPYSKTYTITPAVTVTEGEHVDLYVTLGEAAPPAAGLVFDIAVTFASPAAGKAQASDIDGIPPTTVNVPHGRTEARVQLPTVMGDLLGEGSETFTVSITDVRHHGAAVPEWKLKPGGTKTATVTITEDTANARIAFGSDAASTTGYAANVAENVAGGTFNVPVTVSHAPIEPTTFGITVAGTGTATEYDDAENPGDFRIAAKSVTFGPRQPLTQHVSIAITDDDDVETLETIILSIDAAADPALNLSDHYARDAAGATATITINSDEVASGSTKTYTITPSATAGEGANAELTVTLGEDAPEGGVAFTVGYEYNTYNGKRASAGDTGATPTTFTVTAGSRSGTLSVPIARDAIEDDNESFIVTVAATTPGWGVAPDGQATATVTITDTTETVSFSASAYTIIEGNPGNVLVRRTGSTEHETQVRVSVLAYGFGRFAGRSDVTTFSRKLVTIPAGAAAAALGIQTHDDDVQESDETFFLTLESPPANSGYRAVQPTFAQATIKDNDGAEYVTTYAMGDGVTVNEGETANLTIALGQPVHSDGLALNVYYDYSGSSATEQDTGDAPTTLSVPAGATTATLSIPIATDTDADDGETFVVTITPGSRDTDWTVAPAGSASATVTIKDVAAAQQQQATPVTFDETELSAFTNSIIEYTVGQATPLNLRLPEASGGAGTLTYYLDNRDPRKPISEYAQGLFFDPATRTLTSGVGPDEPAAGQRYALTYWAEDENGATATSYGLIAVNGPPAFPAIADQSFTAGEAASVTLPAATGGSDDVVPLTYRLEPPVPGLSFDTLSRTISGTPTATGSTAMTYTATDRNGVSGSATFTIAVVGDSGAPTSPPGSVQAATQPGSKTFVVTWAAVTDATGYAAQVAALGGSFATDNVVNSAPPGYFVQVQGSMLRAIVMVPEFGNYQVRVAAVNAEGAGPWATTTATVAEPAPPPQVVRTYSITPTANFREDSQREQYLTITLDQPAPNGGARFLVTRNYDTAEPADFSNVPTGDEYVTVNAGQTTARLVIQVRKDDLAEEAETFTVTITPPDAGVWEKAGEGRDTATVTIFANGPLPTDVALALANGATRVNEDAGTVAFTATLNSPAPVRGIKVYVFSDHAGVDAIGGYDYVMLSGQFVISEGQRTATASFNITDDAIDEGDELAAIKSSATVGTAYINSRLAFTIVDNDTAGVTVTAANPVAVSEEGTATYTVALDSQPLWAVTITPSSADADAVTVSPTSHTIQPANWNTPVTFTVSGAADDDSNDENVSISHQATSVDKKYAGIAVAEAQVSVLDTTSTFLSGEPEEELPGPVLNLELTATSDSITMSWQAPETGDAPRNYIAHVRPEGGKAGSGKTKTPKAKKTSVTFKNLEAGKTYKVWVRAQNEAGKGQRVHGVITLPE